MIRIFDLSINLLAEIDDYEHLLFTRDLYTHGSFELEINASKQNTQYLVKNNIITVDKDLGKCGIIKVVERTAENTEFVKVTGYTMDLLFKDRIILPVSPGAFDSITAPAETAIKHYIANCITSPVDPNRAIGVFSLTADAAQGATAEYNARYNNLAEYLTEIRTQQQIGITATLNLTTKKFDIDVLVGADHTAGTSAPVIFSTDYDNLLSQSFYETDLDERTYAYVGGEGEGAARAIDTFGTATGLDRKELFVDTNQPLATLPSAGETELAQYQSIVTFEGQVINRLPFIYGQDFDLGDLVTITNKKWGVQLDTRIVQVTEIYEPDGFKLEIAFGNKIPGLKDTVNKMTKKEVK